MDDYSHIQSIANEDVTTLRKKNEDYGSSWRKRGGVGAFMMLARKWDRIETQCQKLGYDIFGVIRGELDAGITKDGLLDDIRDLRSYLLLVESHMTAPKCGEGEHGHPRGTMEDRAGKRTLQEIANGHVMDSLGDLRVPICARCHNPDHHVSDCDYVEGEPGPGYVSQDPDTTPVGRCNCCGSVNGHNASCILFRPTLARPRQA